ncbi:MAG: DNA methyltransferase [Gemmatimonadota bacterium]
MTEKYDKLKALLKELFQLDKPELDFGLYRIMHAKADEVTQFLDQDLLPQVQAAFGLYQPADKAELEKELAKVIAGIEAAGMNPADSPIVKDLRARLTNDAVDIGALESEVYDHLFRFFRRYYSDGDFLSKRVYKPGVYAIPYEGEEVTLHWANKDQYYIKTSEYLRDYAFRLRPNDAQNPMRVHFRLVDATEGEHGNVKEAQGKDRVFILAGAGESGRDFIAEEDGPEGPELVLHFEYRPATMRDWPPEQREEERERLKNPKPPKQRDLNSLAVERVLGQTDAELTPWLAELSKPHVLSSSEAADHTRLEAHLRRYNARHTFDYFIHKDLGPFLRRELDFYIKNEVMHLDDIESESVPRVEQYLSKIKVIRRIAGRIIDFLAQLEDFQKKLWLKKKFVVEMSWCVRVGCIPEAFYAEIAENEAQREEWVALHAIDELQADQGDLTRPRYSEPLTPEFLKANPTLMVDSRQFPEQFTERLMDAMGAVDEQTDGVLFHSENFQALSVMEARYREQVKCVYIDPPYNSPSSEIAYKNDYLHSSWLSLMQGRIDLTERILGDGTYVIAIDENEQERLGTMLDETWLRSFVRVCVSVRHNPRGVQGRNFSHCHEYAYFLYPSDQKTYIGERVLEEADVRNLRDSGLESDRTDARNCFYPIVVKEGAIVSIGAVPDDDVHPPQNQNGAEGTISVWPIDTSGREKKWRYARQSVERILPKLKVRETRGKLEIYFAKDTGTVRTLWSEPQFDASEYGTKLLQQMFGTRDLAFSYPKSLYTLVETIRVTTGTGQASILDYFAGSGTTGHAVINLNREDGGQRKLILVEMGDYFDTVLLPRLKKVTFSPEWKDGKPKRLATPEEAERSPRIMKVVRLESYEDTLNNLETRRSDPQQDLLDQPQAQGENGLKEQYLLRYMLDVETRGSPSLLNIPAFADPTAYELKVKRPGSDESREVAVDLLETFNWLIGLTVRHLAVPQSFTADFERDEEKRLSLKGRLRQEADGPHWFRTVTGSLPDGRRTLVIWRKLTGEPEEDNLVLDEWFTKQGYSSKDSEFDLIYVNGGNNLENLKTPEDTWKVRLIEEDFHRLMFAAEVG